MDAMFVLPFGKMEDHGGKSDAIEILRIWQNDDLSDFACASALFFN